MELVEGVYASDFTKKTLAQFGWKDGDAIPTELGPMLLAIKEQTPASTRSDVLIDAEKLTPEHIEKVKDLLARAHAFAQRQKRNAELDKATASMSPTVADAYKKVQEQKENAPQIIDDRADPPVIEPETEKEPEAI